MGSGEDVYFQVKYVLLFIQNNHLFYVLAEPRLTAVLTLASPRTHPSSPCSPSAHPPFTLSLYHLTSAHYPLAARIP
jgi:hypothetical protein